MNPFGMTSLKGTGSSNLSFQLFPYWPAILAVYNLFFHDELFSKTDYRY